MTYVAKQTSPCRLRAAIQADRTASRPMTGCFAGTVVGIGNGRSGLSFLMAGLNADHASIGANMASSLTPFWGDGTLEIRVWQVLSGQTRVWRVVAPCFSVSPATVCSPSSCPPAVTMWLARLVGEGDPTHNRGWRNAAPQKRGHADGFEIRGFGLVTKRFGAPQSQLAGASVPAVFGEGA